MEIETEREKSSAGESMADEVVFVKGITGAGTGTLVWLSMRVCTGCCWGLKEEGGQKQQQRSSTRSVR